MGLLNSYITLLLYPGLGLALTLEELQAELELFEDYLKNICAIEQNFGYRNEMMTFP